MATETEGLKVFGFMSAYFQLFFAAVLSVYAYVKALIPEKYVSQINGLESTVAERSAPYVEKYQDQAYKYIKQVDSKINGAIEPAKKYKEQLVQSGAQINEQIQPYKEKIVQGINDVRSGKVDKSYVYTASQNASQAVKDLSSKMLAEGAPVERVISRAKSNQTVQSWQSKVGEYAEYAIGKYSAVHKVVIQSEVYDQLWKLGFSVMTSVQESQLYSKVEEYLRPYTGQGSTARSICTQVAQSPYTQQFINHIKPQPVSKKTE